MSNLIATTMFLLVFMSLFFTRDDIGGPADSDDLRD